ncbi:MAG TPA: carboxypeptidase regulatory-like domain-containing protein [Edaphobacter sp.]|nr:carboxypeptidase regulatory-like domain-containing protein [Edaphobacter sp.]
MQELQLAQRTAAKIGRASSALVFAVVLFTLCFISRTAYGQSASGTIAGTVADATGAVIPDAKVILENTASGDKRETVSNGSGFFNFAAVPSATYKITITSSGFVTWVATDIILHLGEHHVLPNIAMKVATSTAQVEVVSSQAGVIPLDSGESSVTIGSRLVENLSIQGRDAAELVKFMPGMGMNTGLGQTQFSSQTTSTNSGPIGSFSANGTQPYGGMQMTLDGASLVDVGNQGTQIANVNQDTTAEFTFLNAAFGADTPRGPTIIQITSKGGGSSYHGNVYTYLRNWQANANDSYFKATAGGVNQRPMDHQLYPGGTFGGPIRIPGTNFNRNRDKLFFFGGFEKMFQNPFPTLHQLVVPTTAMINGDFSAATLPGAQTSGSSWWPTSQVPCANAASWTSFCPSGGSQANPFPNGQIPASMMDPNGKALLTYLNKVNAPNIDPATHNGYNFQYLDAAPVNRWELRLRGDYAPTVNDKISVVYTKQNEADINHFGVWWWPAATAPMGSPLNATTKASLWTVNYVKVLNPSTTNEASFAYTYFTFPAAFSNPSAMSASAAGYNTSTPFDTSTVNGFDQLPNLISWGCGTGSTSGCFPGLYAPPMIKAFGNSFGNIKKVYSIQDNLSKVMGRHTLKAGFFWDENFQTQTTGYGNWTQGAIEFDTWSTYTTNNPLADLLLGHTDGISQYSAAPVHDMAYHEWAIYGQDRWQMTRKFTLNYGLRLDHDGQWYAVNGPGLSVFDPSSYDNTANAPTWTGAKWHQNDKTVSQSGFGSKLLNPDVRFGGAYDMFGDGKLVLRGGFGMYRWQFSEGDIDAALNPALNVQSITTPSTTSFAQLATFKPSTSGSWCATNSTCPTGVDLIQKGDDKTPYTMNWNFMIDKALPGRMSFEAQYIGNRTDNALITGNGSTASFYANINKIPVGGLFGTDALTGHNYWNENCAKGTCAAPSSDKYNGYRPYANYGVLNLVRHGSYSNYHGLVAALQKQTGKATFLVNYTYSKVMGIRDGQTDNGGGNGTSIDGFNLRNNYGPLAYDHTHIFNATYYTQIPGLNSNALLKAATNGWQLSGDLQVQSGAPIQANTNGTLNVTWNGVSNTQLLGTDGMVLMPYLTCDPRKGGAGAGNHFNPNCFQTPTTIGQNGPAVWPYIKGPTYFNTDIAVFRDVKVAESQHIQFRASAFNFLNHPLPQLGLGSDINLHLACNATSSGGCASGSTNTNTTTTGVAEYKTGRRVVEVALKYNF